MGIDNLSELFARRLERLDTNIADALAALYKGSLGIPAVAVAVVGLADTTDADEEVLRILYLGLVLLAAVTVLFAVRQMLIVFVHAGQRKAIEEFAETNGILPRGVFSWENGPARELSDARRLDGRINPARYIEPGLAGILHAGVSTYGLGRLQTFGVLSAWFIAPLALAVFGLVMVLSAFWYIPATMERVYSWTRGELAKKADTD